MTGGVVAGATTGTAAFVDVLVEVVDVVGAGGARVVGTAGGGSIGRSGMGGGGGRKGFSSSSCGLITAPPPTAFSLTYCLYLSAAPEPLLYNINAITQKTTSASNLTRRTRAGMLGGSIEVLDATDPVDEA